MDEDKFKSTIWDLWKEAHDGIAPVRREVFKLHGSVIGLENAKEDTSKENPDLTHCYEYKSVSLEDDSNTLSQFAQEAFTCARGFQEATQKLKGETPAEVLRITTRAGVLLYYTEQILQRYDGLKARAQASKNSVPLPTNFGAKILSEAMTAAATARDQMVAAQGFVKNLKERAGSKERWRLLLRGLLPTLIIYLLFHPSISIFLTVFHITLIPSIYRVYWEIVFWSLFGAISISFITMSEDVNRDDFDPRHLFKYEYRIAVAPFIAAVLVLFVSILGFTSGGTTIKLDLANPNFPVVVLLSFLFGFFGKRSLDLLDNVWQRLVPSTRAEEKQKTPKTA